MLRELLDRRRHRRYDARYVASQRERTAREKALARELGALRVLVLEDPQLPSPVPGAGVR